MASVHIQIFEKAAQWFQVELSEIMQQPRIYPHKEQRLEDFTKGQQAFAMICYWYSQFELRDSRMTEIQIARYFQLSEVQILKAISRHDKFMFRDRWYQQVNRQVKHVIDTHTQLIYERTEQQQIERIAQQQEGSDNRGNRNQCRPAGLRWYRAGQTIGGAERQAVPY